MVGVLVMTVGVVLTAVGISLGTFQPLSGFTSPVPQWLGWAAAFFGVLTTAAGALKSVQEARLAAAERKQRTAATRRQRRETS